MDTFYCIWLTYVVVGWVNALSSEGTPYNYNACAGAPFQASCVNDEVIAVQSIQHGGKLTGSCSSSDCCVYDKADCFLPYSDNNLQDRCSGRELCESSSPAAVTGCGSGYPLLSHYLTMEYYCVPEARIASMCGSSSLTGQPVYIENFEYPTTTIRSSDTTCSCSVEANNCSSRINVSFVHFQLSDGGICTGTQKIQINDDGTVYDYTCFDNTGYEITSIRTSESNYLKVTLDNPNGVNGGVFWIGFEATTSSAELTVKCPATSKTMCIVKKCAAPTAVYHSSISPKKGSYAYGESVTYTCEAGYQNTGGPLSRQCTDTDAWSGTAPVCTSQETTQQSSETTAAVSGTAGNIGQLSSMSIIMPSFLMSQYMLWIFIN